MHGTNMKIITIVKSLVLSSQRAENIPPLTILFDESSIEEK